jgi:hypothetical protein|tara:strand:- start:3372 stop:3902 length:531 start_codon:yes stop_codon:yes gene_type:complete
MKLDEQIKRIKELLTEQSEGRTGGGVGGTSTNSSGQYMSANAWQAGGILTDDGRQENFGELPVEVDITDGSTEVTIDLSDLTDELSQGPIDKMDGEFGVDDYDGPGSHDKRDPKDGEYTNPLDDMKPCCEPCGDGMWKKCNTDECIYGSISDCELANQSGESNMESLSLGDIWGDN